MKKTVKLKSIHRASEVIYNSAFGDITLAVTRAKGSENYLVSIDGSCKGISRLSAELAWGWVGEYLGISIIQEDKSLQEETPDVVCTQPSKKRSQSKWRN